MADPQAMKDFFVFYCEDDELGQDFSQHLVHRWQTKYKLTGINHHEDSILGKTILADLEHHLDRCKVAVIVLTKKFMHSNYDKFVNDATFLKMINCINTTPRYIPVGIGLERKEFPALIGNTLNPARFQEVGFEAAHQVWKKLDNVLVVNGLITTRELESCDEEEVLQTNSDDDESQLSIENGYPSDQPRQGEGLNPSQQQTTKAKQIELAAPPPGEWPPVLDRPECDGEDVSINTRNLIPGHCRDPKEHEEVTVPKERNVEEVEPLPEVNEEECAAHLSEGEEEEEEQENMPPANEEGSMSVSVWTLAGASIVSVVGAVALTAIILTRSKS